MTQKERVLAMLKSAGQSGVRSDAFIAAGMPRGCARVLELREEGHPIVPEKEGKYTRFRLVGVSSEEEPTQAVSRNNLAADPGQVTPGGVNETACSPAGESPALFEVAEEKPRPRSAFVDGEWGEAA